MCVSPRFVKVVACSILGVASVSRADVFNMPSGQTSLQFVTVGDPGNAPDTTGFGAVPYTYQMGEFDVTAAQYTQFLNAVAATDPYGLYNASMSPGVQVAGIIRSGSAGSYTYSTVAGNGNLPINEVSWEDAARFCNWLANGQPTTGVENSTTTENGSYTLNGAITDQQLIKVTRAQFATYVIPTENEWYKAAYYESGSTTTGYWLYPTQSNIAPSNVLSMTGTNNANYQDPVLGFTDPATGLTPVGSFAGSPGPYGTFDMEGDVYQWNETVISSEFGIRGGSFSGPASLLSSSNRLSLPPTAHGALIGFRIAEVPEPSSLSILAVGTIGLLRRRTRR